MRRYILKKTLILTITVLLVGIVVAPCISSINIESEKNSKAKTFTFNPFKEGWKYRKKITVDSDKVTGNLVNFPLLVSTVDSDLAGKAQSDGDDIIFMDDKGEASQLFHEIESFDVSNGELVAWVNIPVLSSAADLKIFMYYGNPECTNQEFPESVWNSNYCSVWHLNEQNGVFEDSTSNQITGYLQDENSNSVQGYEGKIDTCIKFYGDQDYINFGNVPQYNIHQSTVSCWFKVPVDIIGGALFSVGKCPSNSDRWYCYFHEGPYLGICNDIDDVGNYYTSLDPYNDDTWYYMVATIDGSTHKIFVNGNLVAEGSSAKTWFNLDSHNSFIGAYISLDPGLRGFLKGCVDEMRISSISLSQEWINTQFKNQNEVSSFLTFGREIRPRTRSYNELPFQQFLDSHPNLLILFRYLLGIN
jgi:hypothetical protein